MIKQKWRSVQAAALALLMACAGAHARGLVIVAEDYAPASFLRDGKAVGMDVEVAKTIFDRLGVPYEIRLVPWARAWHMLKTGAADVGLHVSVTEERAADVAWPKNWVWRADFVFMTNRATKAAYAIRSYADAKAAGLSIGIINQDAYHPSFWEAFPSPKRAAQQYHPQLAPAADAATNLRKLALNRIQLFPIALVLGNYLAREDPRLDNVTHYDSVLFSKPYPNAFSRHSDYRDAKFPNIGALMQAYDAELERLKSRPDEYRKLLQRYQ